MLTTLKNWEQGARTDSNTKALAADARSIWSELVAQQKEDFMQRYKQTKQSKSLRWVRNFQESMSRKKCAAKRH